MKIVKRDGRTVEYNSDKIRIAIGKANLEVSQGERLSTAEIEDIILYIESLDKKRMLVEDIQDIIEEKIMEKGKYSLAKKYIIYRYKRSIIRQTNTTDASILSLLKNSSYGENNCLVVNRQRDIMAGEASKDLAYRLLLPQNVVNADKDNRLKFCNVEYFTEPTIESTKLKLSDMFENGTVINGVKIEEPKSFQSACNVLVEIISSVSFCQTGAIYVELKDLFKYYNMSYEKKYEVYKSLMRDMTKEQISAVTETQVFLEVKSGIQTILYQMNTIPISNGLEPKVYFLINPEEITCQAEEKIVFEFVKQKTIGIKDEDGNYRVTKYPMIMYSFERDYEKGMCGYIASELANSDVEYIAMSPKRFMEFRKELDRFNQGSIILNLARLALDSVQDEETDFMEILEQNLGYCYEGILCRNHNLQGIYSDKSPIHWRHGAIARLGQMEKIDSYLRKEYSTLSLVVVGFEAALKILGDDKLKKMIRDKISETVKSWNKENSFEVVISNYFETDAIDEIYKKDESTLKKFGVLQILDSLDFMSENYFKNGTFVLCTRDKDELVNDSILEKNIIVKRAI